MFSVYASQFESGDHAVVSVLIGEYMYSLAIFFAAPLFRSIQYTAYELSMKEIFWLSGAHTGRS